MSDTLIKVLIVLMFFIIVAQAWKIYQLENRTPEIIYRCPHAGR